MRRLLCLLLLSVFVFGISFSVYADADDSHYKDITISFNNNACPEEKGKDITIQLFKNGEIEGELVVLNQTNNYTYTYENLAIFDSKTSDEIKYDVKVYENGTYRLLDPKHQSYDTTHINKWVQVLPENIKEGHTYVFTTNNWNYESNGFSKVIYLRGDITAKGAKVVPEYNIIDSMKSYYSIDGEPIDNTRWTASKVPVDDPEYNSYKDYFMFTNETEGKKLTLTAYIREDGVPNWIFKRSGKTGWVNEAELNTNKVSLTPVSSSKGGFYIGTYSLLDEPYNIPQYLTLGNQNQYQAGSNIDEATEFKAFEYIDKEVQVGESITIEESMCPTDEVVIDKNSTYKRDINVNFDCKNCESKKDKGIVIQLFANGKKVSDGEIRLNRVNGFKYVYKDLPVFSDGTLNEINYRVDALIDGKYYPIASKDISYKKEFVKKWIQVLPENIKEGHTYVFTTDNWNYKNNGFSKVIYLRGDITAKGAKVVPEYNIIDSMKSYYSIDGEPIDNTRWTASKVPVDDPEYDSYKDYFMFTNETEGKKLTLTAYIREDGVPNWIFKRSGKTGWVNETELNTNKIILMPVPSSKGGFYMGTYSLLDEPYNIPQYLTLGDQNQYQAGSNIDEATEFKAFEYLEKEISVKNQMVIESSLCEVLNYPYMNNPNTNQNGMIILLIIAIIFIGFIVVNTKVKI